jgi:stage V sporulation protein D (sporulation-specific penicillin-binding protein)
MVSVRRRIGVLFLVFVAVFMVLAGRLLYLEVIRNQYFLTLALDQRMRPVPLLASRGDILDRNQNKLAVSMSADAVYATPVEIKDVEQAVEQLAPLLDLDPEWLRERLTRNQAMVWLKLKVDPMTARQVIELAIPGIGVTERPQRFYPHGSLAAQVIGFAGMDNQGLEGLEAYYDRYLRGNPGMIIRERDARGRAIPGGSERRLPPQDGYDLVLTLDQVIQYIAERELQKAVTETESELGIAVFVRPQTGEILASAVYPSFDPNEYASVPSEIWRNRALTDQYEPGSIFKVITLAAALEANAAKLDEVFVDPIRLVRWGGAVSCWRAQGHGAQTLVEATENSCNPVFAILAADRLGPKTFYKYASAFGFGARSGVDFPGEARGLLPRPGETRHGELLQWANIGFGQGVAISPIQMVMAVSAIANGGHLIRPRLALEIRDKSGEPVKTFEPEIVRRVLSEQTAQDVAKTMRSVVVNGSGSRADAPGYRIAGKTGTAEMPSPQGGYSSDRIASFVGFGPVDDPQIAGVVMLVRIGVRPAYGGTWAAPVFASIVDEALEYMGVERRADPGSLQTPPTNKTFVPNVQSLTLEEATRMLDIAGLKAVIDGADGSYVEHQMPRPGAQVQRGSSVHLSLYPESDRDEDVRVPDVVGFTLRDASVLFAQAGLRLRIEGVGEQVYEQEPEAGSYVHKGDVVTLRLK